MTPVPASTPLHVGAIIFSQIDQMDFTGPFEVLSRLSNSTFHVIAKEKTPVRDAKGLILTPEKTFSDVPPLDVLIVPGGTGQVVLMEDDVVLDFLRTQVAHAKIVLSVCTGALTLGAAGLLRGKRATTHWASFPLLPLFGAIAVDERVVIDADDRLVSTAGVTAGVDGALRVAAMLRGEAMAQEIQLYMEYDPEPPFTSGRPKKAPPSVLASARAKALEVTQVRLAIAHRVATKLGLFQPEG